MRQTSAYAKLRPGRCSVYWGDQIFVPSVGTKGGTAPADILAALRPMPTKEEWEAEELHQYGLIAVDSKGNAMQLEKVTYDVAMKYLPSDVVQVGTSLGSFSLSAELTEGLMKEFATELAWKTASLDSDPHFWMPLTMTEANYITVMATKETTADEATAHFKRMAAFKKRMGYDSVLGCVDIGQKAYWWDYGRLELYMINNLAITEDNASAHALRTFMKLEPKRQLGNKLGKGVSVDPSAVVLNCKIGAGRIGPNAVLVNVVAPSVDVEGCVLVQTTSLSPIGGKAGLLYNACDTTEGSMLSCDEVRADVFMPGGVHHVMKSKRSIDGGKVWKQKLDFNPFSFEGIYKQNQTTDTTECSGEARKAHDAARAKIK